MTHDATKRREARVRRWENATPSPRDLAEAGGGFTAGTVTPDGTRWLRVRGPHLRQVRSRCARNTTGVVGVSLIRTRKAPNRPIRTYYVAGLGKQQRFFCLETLGRSEAFRRAVKARAEHEIKVREANAAILRARANHNHQPTN